MTAKRNKRIAAVLLALIMMMGIAAPITSFAASETVYINSAEDLIELSENCRVDSWSMGKKVQLNDDIDLRGKKFTPIPIFCGVFEGHGHTISGLEIDTNGSVMGLFRYNEGEIYRLNVKVTVRASGSGRIIGGIAGENSGLIENCTVSGSIEAASIAGSIAGENKGEITDCTGQAKVSASHYAGGIVGINSGTLLRCSNDGGINLDITEGTYASETTDSGEFSNLIRNAENLPVTTDVGGIAGFSSGKITECKNRGEVGYLHVGYNIGGIVGRQSGAAVVSGCDNRGTVNGRKDIGGIVGQSEPYIRIDGHTAEELSRELDKLYQLNDKLFVDAISSSDDFSDQLQEVYDILDASPDAADKSDKSGNAADKVGKAAQSARDFANSNSDTIAELSERIKQGDGSLSPAVSDFADGSKQMDDALDALSRAIEPVIVSDEMTDAEKSEINNAMDRISDANGRMGKAVNNLAGVLEGYKNDGELDSDSQSDRGKEALDAGAAAAEAGGDIYEGLSSISGVVNNRSGNSSDRRSNDESDDLLADMQAVNKQFNVVMHMMTDIMVGLSTSGQENIVKDESAEKIADAKISKVANSDNRGSVQGDKNVGGVTGSMGIEYDFTPEDDVDRWSETIIAGVYYARCVVTDCRNYGQITGKESYVGGIVGMQDLGVVDSCNTYSGAMAPGGSYVGGVAGKSVAEIRNSGAKCALEGENYVGGIAGYGCRISGCATMVQISGAIQHIGAIAGDLDKTGVASKNYFTGDTLGGIDGVSYAASACPLSYESLMGLKGLPDEFKHFSLTFMADGKVVAQVNFQYGESISEEDIPAVPKKSGFTGSWPEYNYSNLTFSDTLEAIYTAKTTVISSEEREADTERALVLAESSFSPKATVTVQESAHLAPQGETVLAQYHVEIKDRSADDGSEIKLHVLVPNGRKKCAVYILKGKAWKKLDTTMDGSYVVFSVNEREVDICLIKESDAWLYAAVGAGVGAVCAGSYWLIRRKKKKLLALEAADTEMAALEAAATEMAALEAASTETAATETASTETAATETDGQE